ncbi:MAG: DEAD/DEAH box helicase family protein, partial [Rhizomicrobium sp.]
HDVLIALNTGAGKTIMGLLIAQSLVNEGVPNVVYCCATIDLVEQTAAEARKIGLAFTTRTDQAYSDSQFESGKTFCITTYQALFNGFSAIRRKNFPGAVIFDDAHVAESIIRDDFTLRFTPDDQPIAFRELGDLFEDHFKKLGRKSAFDEARGKGTPRILMASPAAVHELSGQITDIVTRSVKGAEKGSNIFRYPNLQDHLGACAVVFGRGACEITPPFLPSLAIDVFERPIRRIYLSATLQYKTDFVRGFGRLPTTVIEPRNDAGNGERLILGTDRIAGRDTLLFEQTLIAKHKVLIAVPSYPAAKKWEAIVKPVEKAQFSAKLAEFRASRTSGAFMLVSRVDGIDLPHDTCRIMILDGLPAGTSLFERYLWEFVDLKNLAATKIANRIAQLFGRINRGRNDYGAFLISGRDLQIWLSSDRNVSLLPDLLQQQITLGRHVQDGFGSTDPAKVAGLVDQVLSRDAGWISYYGDNIDKRRLDEERVERARALEEGMVQAALATAEYAKLMWDGDVAGARKILEDCIEGVARTDSRLAGWLNIWLGGNYQIEGDAESATNAFRRARNQIGINFNIPTKQEKEGGKPAPPLEPFASEIDELASTTSGDAFARSVRQLKASLADLDGASPRQMEEAVRALGELLGFNASRPDNDLGTGPDVLWEAKDGHGSIGFELKTDKKTPATYRKKDDIGQGHDHLEWIAKNKPGKCLGLIFVGPEGKCSDDANPDDNMWLCEPRVLADCRNSILAIIDDVRKQVPLARRAAIVANCSGPKWQIEGIFERIRGRSLQSDKR